MDWFNVVLINILQTPANFATFKQENILKIQENTKGSKNVT